MNFREMRTKLIGTYGKFVFLPDNPEISKLISTHAFTHLVIDADVRVYAHKIMEEQLESELQEEYDVIYETPQLDGEYYVSPEFKIRNASFKFRNGVEILNKALRKPFVEELSIIREASIRISRAVEMFWNELKLEMLENEAAGLLEYFLIKEGIESFTYPTIVTSGARSKYPFPKTGKEKLSEDKIVYIDASPEFQGYTLNFSRVVFTGDREEWINALERINEMYNSLSTIHSGMSCNLLDERIRSVGNFPHYSVVPSGGFYQPYAPGNCVLEEDMLMTVVPSIYMKDGVIRVKRNIIVGKSKPEFLI